MDYSKIYHTVLNKMEFAVKYIEKGEKKVKTTRKTALLSLILIMLFAAPIMLTTQVHATTVPPTWNITGQWDLAFYCIFGSSDAQGNTFYHHMDIASENQATGALTGTGYWIGVQKGGNYTTGFPDYPVDPAEFMWTLFPDSCVSGNSVHIHLYFTSGHGPPDWTSAFDATIDSNGNIVDGAWQDSAGNIGTVSSYHGQAIPYVILTFQPGSTAEVSIIASSTPPSFTFGGGEGQLALQPLSLGTVYYPLPGIIGVYYDVSIISGSFSGLVRICVHYDPALLPPGTNPQNLHLCIYDPVDFNGDGTVNGQDIAQMQKEIKRGDNDPRYDINHDGKVDNADLLIVKQFASHGLIVNQGQNGLSQARLPWLDITAYVDTTNHYVCGVTDHFSAFGMH